MIVANRPKTLRFLVNGSLSAALLLGVAALGIHSPAAAQPTFGYPENTITTQGHGEVRVRPDSVSVSVTTQTIAPTLNQARTQANSQMTKVIAALRGLNLPNLTIQTQSAQVYPEYAPPDKGRPPKVTGYRAINTLSASIRGAAADTLGELASRLIDTALNNGADQANLERFFVQDMNAPRAQALEEAVRDARRNADVMARAANVSIKGLYSLEGTPQYGGIPMPMAALSSRAMEAAPAPVPIETGEMTVTSDVTARFRY